MITHRPRGFSLIELLVALGVSSIVVAGALFLLISQQRTFQDGTGDRALQEGGRVALEQLTADVRSAGYGMDPSMAFDLGEGQVPMDRAILAPGESTVTFGGFACKDAVTCRDHTDAPDELVVLSREPAFGHLVKAASVDSLTIDGPLNTPLQAGQVLQVICYSGELYWAYVTVGKTVAATTPADADPVIELAGQGGAADGTFGAQNKYLANSCFTGEARVFKINRSRYLVETYDEAGKVVAWGTAGARPYLMRDRGFLDADGQPVHEVIAPDVEDLQVAYLFPLAAAGTTVRGSTEGEQLVNGAGGIDLAPTTVPPYPTYATPRLDPIRTTGHPSNIRAVRVAVVVRHPEATPGRSDPELPAALNRKAVAREANRRRAVFETTVSVPNMESRGPNFPTYGDPTLASDAPLNHGGG